MTALEFFHLVANMRDTQKRYFETRDRRTFLAARALENDVDREIRRVKAIQVMQEKLQSMNQEAEDFQ